MHHVSRFIPVVVFLSASASCGMAAIYSDNFNVDTSGNYMTLTEGEPGRDGAIFAYDYGAIGIPEAPRSSGGGTTGLRMFANNPAAGTTNATSAVQVIPQGLTSSLSAVDYRLSVDVWMNFNGPAPGGGAGSTEAFMTGVGWTGSAAIEAGIENGTYFTITGEGGSSTDVRSFTNDGFNAPGINQGPSNNTNDAFYAGIFPGGIDLGALPFQGGMDSQTGTTVAGQMAFAWHMVDIDVIGSQVDFYVDGLLIASDADANRAGDIMLGYADYFSSESGAPQWSFGLYDNLSVTQIPEPASTGLLLLGAAGIALRRRR